MTKIYSVLLLLLPCISVVAQDKKELKLIDSYFKEGQYEEAKKLLDKNITQYPKNGDIQFYMGKYYYQKQDNDKARYHLLRALWQQRRSWPVSRPHRSIIPVRYAT